MVRRAGRGPVGRQALTWQAVLSALLADALHARVGEAVVALARVATAAAHGGEDHEVVQLGACLAAHPAGTCVTPSGRSQPRRPAPAARAHLSRFMVPWYLGLLTSRNRAGLWFSNMPSLRTCGGGSLSSQPGLGVLSLGTLPRVCPHHGQVEDTSDRPQLRGLGHQGPRAIKRAGILGGHQHLHTLAPPLADLLGLVACKTRGAGGRQGQGAPLPRGTTRGPTHSPVRIPERDVSTSR